MAAMKKARRRNHEERRKQRREEEKAKRKKAVKCGADVKSRRNEMKAIYTGEAKIMKMKEISYRKQPERNSNQ